MRRAGKLLAVLALAVAGCGGGAEDKAASDEDRIRAVIEEAYPAFAAGDSGTFCPALSADYKADFEEYYEGACDDATLDKILATVPADAKAQLESPEIGGDLKIGEDGKSAYPEVNGDDLELVKEGEDWKLDDFDVPGGS